jgi:hypothetical protein
VNAVKIASVMTFFDSYTSCTSSVSEIHVRSIMLPHKKVKGIVVTVLAFLTEHQAMKAYWGVEV